MAYLPPEPGMELKPGESGAEPNDWFWANRPPPPQSQPPPPMTSSDPMMPDPEPTPEGYDPNIDPGDPYGTGARLKKLLKWFKDNYGWTPVDPIKAMQWLVNMGHTLPPKDLWPEGWPPRSKEDSVQIPKEFTEAWFRELIGDRKPSATILKEIEQELAKYGIRIQGNAAGTKWDTIILPDGRYIDVIKGAGSANPEWWWSELSTEEEAAPAVEASATSDLSALAPALAPWTEPFQYPSYEPPPPFQAPTGEEVFQDPGFMFRLDEGQKAIERAAAGRGLLNTGGTLKALTRFGQDLASQEYGNVYNRRLGEYQLQGGLERGDWARDYGKALGEFNLGREIFYANQDRPWNKLTGLAGLGQQSTQYLGNLGQGYANLWGNTLMNLAGGMGNLWTQGANARAAGLVGSANAYTQALGNIPWWMVPFWNWGNTGGQ